MEGNAEQSRKGENPYTLCPGLGGKDRDEKQALIDNMGSSQEVPVTERNFWFFLTQVHEFSSSRVQNEMGFPLLTNKTIKIEISKVRSWLRKNLRFPTGRVSTA